MQFLISNHGNRDISYVAYVRIYRACIPDESVAHYEMYTSNPTEYTTSKRACVFWNEDHPRLGGDLSTQGRVAEIFQHIPQHFCE